MKMFLVSLLLCGACCVAQSKDFAFSTELDSSIAKGVTVTLTYTLPKEAWEGSKTDAKQTPVHIMWHWGDELPGARQKNYFESAFTGSSKVTHTYKPGRYSVMVTVTDVKNRLVKQDSIQIKVSLPVEIAQL